MNRDHIIRITLCVDSKEAYDCLINNINKDNNINQKLDNNATISIKIKKSNHEAVRFEEELKNPLNEKLTDSFPRNREQLVNYYKLCIEEINEDKTREILNRIINQVSNAPFHLLLKEFYEEDPLNFEEKYIYLNGFEERTIYGYKNSFQEVL